MRGGSSIVRTNDARESPSGSGGPEVCAERIGATVGIQADRRRDRLQQMVAADQDAVAEEAEVPVGVARQLDHVPPGERAPLIEEVGIERVADERRERVPL